MENNLDDLNFIEDDIALELSPLTGYVWAISPILYNHYTYADDADPIVVLINTIFKNNSESYNDLQVSIIGTLANYFRDSVENIIETVVLLYIIRQFYIRRNSVNLEKEKENLFKKNIQPSQTDYSACRIRYVLTSYYDIHDQDIKKRSIELSNFENTDFIKTIYELYPKIKLLLYKKDIDIVNDKRIFGVILSLLWKLQFVFSIETYVKVIDRIKCKFNTQYKKKDKIEQYVNNVIGNVLDSLHLKRKGEHSIGNLLLKNKNILYLPIVLLVDEEVTVDGITFTDCGENSIRNFLRLLSYKNPDFKDKIHKKYQCFETIDQNGWANLMSKHKTVNYVQQDNYEIKDGLSNDEINDGLSNDEIKDGVSSDGTTDNHLEKTNIYQILKIIFNNIDEFIKNNNIDVNEINNQGYGKITFTITDDTVCIFNLNEGHFRIGNDIINRVIDVRVEGVIEQNYMDMLLGNPRSYQIYKQGYWFTIINYMEYPGFVNNQKDNLGFIDTLKCDGGNDYLSFYEKVIYFHRYSDEIGIDEINLLMRNMNDSSKELFGKFMSNNIETLETLEMPDLILHINQLDGNLLDRRLVFDDEFDQVIGPDILNKFSELTHLTFGNKFNKPLNNSLNGLNNLTHLSFGTNFNTSLKKSLNGLNNLTHLSFGTNFNTSLKKSLNGLNNLTHLTLGSDFYVERLDGSLGESINGLKNLTHLTLDQMYTNERLNNITHLTYSDMFNDSQDSIDNYPKLTHLTFGRLFNQQLNYFPNHFNPNLTLTHLTFGEDFDKPIGNSLNSLKNLTHLTFGKDFDKPIGNSLYSLKNLTHLTFGEDFDKPLGNSLNSLKNLTHLTFGDYFDKPLGNLLDSLKSLTHLKFGSLFNGNIIPHYQKRSDRGLCFKHSLPSLKLEEITLGIYYNDVRRLNLYYLPNLKKIILNGNIAIRREIISKIKRETHLQLATSYQISKGEQKDDTLFYLVNENGHLLTW